MSGPAFTYHPNAYGYAGRDRTYAHPQEGMTYNPVPFSGVSPLHQMHHVPTPSKVDREKFLLQQILDDLMRREREGLR